MVVKNMYINISNKRFVSDLNGDSRSNFFLLKNLTFLILQIEIVRFDYRRHDFRVNFCGRQRIPVLGVWKKKKKNRNQFY